MLKRKEQGVDKFCKVFGFTFSKLGPMECDFKIIGEKNTPVGYAQVVVTESLIRYSWPLSVSVSDLSLLKAKVMNPVLIWACDDGICYTNLEDTYGNFRWVDGDLRLFFYKQKSIKYIKYGKVE